MQTCLDVSACPDGHSARRRRTGCGGYRQPPVKAIGPVATEAVSGFSRQALHAAELGFDHPVTGERLRFESPLPDDMDALIEALRAATPA